LACNTFGSNLAQIWPALLAQIWPATLLACNTFGLQRKVLFFHAPNTPAKTQILGWPCKHISIQKK
jgi:hypothetical protein